MSCNFFTLWESCETFFWFHLVEWHWFIISVSSSWQWQTSSVLILPAHTSGASTIQTQKHLKSLIMIFSSCVFTVLFISVKGKIFKTDSFLSLAHICFCVCDQVAWWNNLLVKAWFHKSYSILLQTIKHLKCLYIYVVFMKCELSQWYWKCVI